MAPTITGLLIIALLSCEVSSDHRRDFPELPAHRLEVFQQLATLRGASRDRRDAPRRRPARQAGSCGTDTSDQGALEQHTHQNTFEDDDGSSVTLAWVGDGTGIILAMTTFNLPLAWLFFSGASRLYRSEDYGKTFTDISNLLKNYYIRKEFGINVGPEHSKKVILTADESKQTRRGGIILRSSDSGRSFHSIRLPFHPSLPMVYHSSHSDHLLAYSTDHDLWLSQNFGETWKKIHQFVYTFSWGPGSTIFFSTHPNNLYDVNDRGILVLKRTMDFGKTYKILLTNVYSFGFAGRFLFASVVSNQTQPRSVYVSADQGDSWNKAQLPPVSHEQFYSILAADDEMIFIHVDEPGNNGFGTIYTSDDRGLLFSKSLERHLFSDTSGTTDFTNVTSLRGVYITNVLDEDNNIRSVITFDSGGEWKPLKKPDNSQCDATAKNPQMCNLHIHAAYSISQTLDVPLAPLTAPNAVGLILAHGSVGDAISTMIPDVYVSDDGGYTWSKALTGPHYYAILDSGGLIVAVESLPDKPIDIIKYSTDEGQCWKHYNFTNETFMFVGLVSEPGTKSMNVSLWGYKHESIYTTTWLSITIDFEELLTRDCEEKDYVRWLAHSTAAGAETDGCILGYKETFQRLTKASVCRNGRDYIVTKEQSFCPCTLNDYMCDFGYYREGNSDECKEQPDLKNRVLEFCLQGKEELLKTQGYRKVPGDKCEGGFMPNRSEQMTNTRCEQILSVKDPMPKITIFIIVLSVLGASVLMIAAIVLIFKKYVCGGRALVYRYSVLQTNTDEVCIAESLDSNRSNTERTYHDDSDVDLLD
ncbi:sortilin-like [Pristis pectinata]|uniref:sortilin-like n=1 Tax=Pristis pectinata TaxID=685728 RepID=UPI00223E4F45|nr:sortilin-like [Pristis pectinata]